MKEKQKQIRKKMFGKGAKIVFASTDEESEKQFKALMKLRTEYRKAGGVFKKK
jgi:hypothetical protein